MGYSIQYNPENNRKFPIKTTGKRNKRWIITVALLTLLGVGTISTGGIDILKNFLLPGDPAATEAAFTALIEDVQGGEPVSSAITAFCQEIIDHADQNA